MRSLLVGIVCVTWAMSASAQESQPERRVPFRILERPEFEEREEDEPIETDRDSFTPATRIVGRGSSIFEAAYSFVDNPNNFETHSYPEFLYRYGLTRRLELRLGWNYEVGGGSSAVSGSQGVEGLEGVGIERESRLLYGLKAQLTEQDGWLPDSIFLLQGQTPTSGEETSTEFLLGYAVGWQLPNRWKVDSSIRYGTATSEKDHFIVWAPSTVLRIPVGERWAVHGEYFGQFAQQSESNFVKHYFSPGVHYLVTQNLEVGVRVGWGLNDQAANSFANVGVGWRY